MPRTSKTTETTSDRGRECFKASPSTCLSWNFNSHLWTSLGKKSVCNKFSLKNLRIFVDYSSFFHLLAVFSSGVTTASLPPPPPPPSLLLSLSSPHLLPHPLRLPLVPVNSTALELHFHTCMGDVWQKTSEATDSKPPQWQWMTNFTNSSSSNKGWWWLSGQWHRLKILRPQVWAQAATRRPSGVKASHYCLSESTRCGDSCRKEQPKLKK